MLTAVQVKMAQKKHLWIKLWIRLILKLTPNHSLLLFLFFKTSALLYFSLRAKTF